jgi:two-component system KDP operon response regulator KdpE
VAQGASLRPHSFGQLELDPVRHRCFVDSQEVKLTAMEFRLLQYLMTHAGVVATFAELIRQVWGYDDPSVTDVVRTTVYRLRRKLGDDPAAPRLLHSIPGIGFLLTDQPPPSTSRDA